MLSDLHPTWTARRRRPPHASALRRSAPFCLIWVGILASTLPAKSVSAGEVLVAVATNFAPVLEEMEAAFEAATGHDLRVLSGSTGKLYAQIVHGAPFEVLLAADQERPKRLVESGWAVPGSRKTYALGRLVLWSADPKSAAAEGPEILRSGRFRKLAIANPDLAPYGLAATQTLHSLDLGEHLRDRLVRGENVGQAFALVATASAELGFVAASQLASLEGPLNQRHWVVSENLYAPIRQDVVLLERGSENPAARDFVDYLTNEPAQDLIRRSGYSTE